MMTGAGEDSNQQKIKESNTPESAEASFNPQEYNLAESQVSDPNGEVEGPDFFDKLGNKAIWLALGLAACIATYVYWDFITLQRVLLYTDIGSDSVNIFYPVWAHYADLWREPGMPSWSMQMAMGQSVGYAGMTDPFFMIYVLVGKNNIPYTIVFVEVTKILLTTLFIFKYLRYLNLKNLTCIIGSLLFAFSGYMIMGTSGWPYHSHEAMLIALFLMVAEKFVKDKSWLWMGIFAFCMAWTNTILLIQLLVIFIAYSVFRNYEKEISLKANIKNTAIGLVSYCLGSLLAFPSVKAGLAFIFKSERVENISTSIEVATYKKTGILSFASGEENTSIFFRLFSNDLMGTGSDYKGWFNYLESPILYIGLPSLIFLVASFSTKEKKQKKIYLFVILTAIILLMFPWFRYAFWGFNLNYFRSFGFYVSILLFYVAIHGINSFLSEKRDYKYLNYCAATYIFLLFVYPGNNSGKLISNQRMIVGLFFVLYIVLIYLRNKKQNIVELKWGLLLLVIIELGLQSHTTINKRNTLSDADLKAGKLYGDSTLQVIDWLKKQDSSFFRIAKYYPSGPAEHMSMNDAMLQNFNGLIGYTSFHQKYYMRFLSGLDCIDPKQPDDIKWTYKILSRPYLSSFAGAKYFLDKDSIKLDTNNFKYIGKKFGIYMYESRIANSIAVAYDQYITEKEFKTLSKWNKDYVLYKAIVIAEENLKEVNGLKHFELKDTITKEDKKAFLLAAQEQGKLLKQNLKVNNNEVCGTLATEKPCVITFLIPFDENWNLLLNENEKNNFIGNYGFHSVFLLNQGPTKIKLINTY
jgi:hypothetical protein